MEKFATNIVKYGMVIIIAIFIWYGFISKQECDLDNIYLWCRLHPFSLGDVIGCVMFFAGALWLTEWPQKLFNFDLQENKNSSFLGVIGVVVAITGVIVIWNT